MTLECPGCGAAFMRAGTRQTYCSARCGDRMRNRAEAAARRVARPQRFCVDCTKTVDVKHGGAIRCRCCAVERKRIQDRARTKLPEVSIVCATCTQPLVRKTNRQKFCSVRCQKLDEYRRIRERTAAAEQQAAASRVCLECHGPIGDRGNTAVRCYECASTKRRSPRSDSIGVRASKALTAKATNLVPRTPARKEAPKVSSSKPQMPNLAGDWYEGWHGCYSSNLSPVAIELLESGKGRPTLTPATRRSVEGDRTENAA